MGSSRSLLLLLTMLGCGAEPAPEPVSAPAGDRVLAPEQDPMVVRPHVPQGLMGPPERGQNLDPSRVPLPTHPVASAVEGLLLEYGSTGDRALLDRSWELISSEPDIHRLPYMLMLQAYVAELRSPGSEDDLAAAMRPEVRATWQYYFQRGPQALAPYFVCGALSDCLLRLSRAGTPLPGSEHFLDRSWDNVSQPVVLDCNGMVVDTATCPRDYATFDRIRWVSQGEERLSHWSPIGASTTTYEEFARLVGVVPGVTVADIGAGIGVFAFPFAEAVGPTGRVKAVEIEPQLVEFMQWRKDQGGFDNLEVILSTPQKIGLEPGSVDVAVLCEMLARLLTRPASSKHRPRGASESI